MTGQAPRMLFSRLHCSLGSQGRLSSLSQHTVKECNPISASHTSCWFSELLLSCQRVASLLWSRISRRALTLEKFRSKVNTCLQSWWGLPHTPSGQCLAWSRRRVSPSSWLLVSSATFSLPSSVIFQHPLSAVTNKNSLSAFPCTLPLSIIGKWTWSDMSCCLPLTGTLCTVRPVE